MRRIVYIHHAERDVENRINPNNPQEDGITERGVKEAHLLGEKMNDNNQGLPITKIITSTYKRCVETSNIINEYLNVEIIKDDRFNEAPPNGVTNARIKEALDEYITKYPNDNILFCTSGVILTAFIYYFYNITDDSNETNKVEVIAQGESISPVNFIIE